ncbi:conserved domain protein [Methylococcus capsulatus str. Bath]|uniref:Conserved domain protein n=1 Tax=Methylococcus capsulatus (strain ATCC 33009 / NCIMB 11132 / Bath) TaxID=243233 RepID=Q60C42_METCA|nr:type I restriction-modification system subunit M N-terminal domain-containing protein [Methylococcus capsulatus]AAU90532.1 conserved domain protein [Methylococcus capsulatus str. Bath]
MTEQEQKQLGNTLRGIADQLRGAMNADDFRDYMLSFLFLRYLSDNYEAAAKKELGTDYPKLAADDRRAPLVVWYEENPTDIAEFEKLMRRREDRDGRSAAQRVSPGTGAAVATVGRAGLTGKGHPLDSPDPGARLNQAKYPFFPLTAAQ